MSERLPLTLVNGEACARLSVSDRGLQYGDGVFETIAINDAKPRFWSRHMTRLQTGCHRLGITCPDANGLHEETELLLRQAPPQCVLKIIVTRGEGGRGYRPDRTVGPTRILQLHEWPDPAGADDGIRATLCSLRLGNNPQLAGIKHLNRLEQVLARAEWDDPAIQEGLLLDQEGRVIEGTMSNLFLVRDGELQTPDLTRCGVAGIMRDVVIEVAQGEELVTQISDITLDRVLQADELFVCNSLIGIWPVIALNSNRYPAGPVTRLLQSRLQSFTVDRHCWRA